MLVIIASLVIFLRRSKKVRLNYKRLRVFGRRRKNILEDEDDDWLNGEVHGLTTTRVTTPYADYPTSTLSSASAARFRGARESGAVTPETILAETPVRTAPSPSPYLLGVRATSSGSIFQEQGVWPPPSEQSRLIDPLVAPSEQVELGNIVDNVMGGGGVPNRQETTRTAASSRYAHSTMSSYGSSSHYPPDTPGELESAPAGTTGGADAAVGRGEGAVAGSRAVRLGERSGDFVGEECRSDITNGDGGPSDAPTAAVFERG